MIGEVGRRIDLNVVLAGRLTLVLDASGAIHHVLRRKIVRLRRQRCRSIVVDVAATTGQVDVLRAGVGVENQRVRPEVIALSVVRDLGAVGATSLVIIDRLVCRRCLRLGLLSWNDERKSFATGDR